MAKDLAKLSKDELKEWLDSFDNVFFDCDGVILSGSLGLIPGVTKSLEVLKSLGKSTKLVTNNSFRTPEEWQRHVLCEHFALEDIIYPIKVVVDFLKKEKFNKKAIVFGMDAVKKAVADAGIEIYKFEFDNIEVKMNEMQKVNKHLVDDESVGAIILDFDFNLKYLQLLKAAIILKRPDVHFICCATEKIFKTSFGTGVEINYIGTHHNILALEDSSGRKPSVFGKPGIHLKNYLCEEFNCSPERTLFVGDSLDTDMPFAKLCGFQKLLVLTGLTKMQNLLNCNEEIRPEHYVNSLGDLCVILHEIHSKI